MEFFNIDAKIAANLMKISQNSTKTVYNLQHCRKLIQIMCQKGAETKMHKYLVGFMNLNFNQNLRNKFKIKVLNFLFICINLKF